MPLCWGHYSKAQGRRGRTLGRDLPSPMNPRGSTGCGLMRDPVCRVGRAATRRWPTGPGGPGRPAPRSESRPDPPYQHVVSPPGVDAGCRRPSDQAGRPLPPGKPRNSTGNPGAATPDNRANTAGASTAGTADIPAAPGSGRTDARPRAAGLPSPPPRRRARRHR